MAYKTIDETFWTDPDVRALSYKGKFLFLYLVTNPHCHYSGMYYLPELFIHIETGLPLKDIKAGLNDLTKEGFIRYDSRRSVIWIIKMARYQIKGGASNKNMMDGIANHFKTLHKTPLIKDFLQYYNDFEIPLESPLEDPIESLAESGEGECIKEKYQEKGEVSGEGDIVEQVVLHLNTVLGTEYKTKSKKTVDLVMARVSQGFSLENFKTVINKKAAQWRNDLKMAPFLRPETLFGTKFESYLNERAGPPLPYSDKTAANIEAAQRLMKKMEEQDGG